MSKTRRQVNEELRRCKNGAHREHFTRSKGAFVQDDWRVERDLEIEEHEWGNHLDLLESYQHWDEYIQKGMLS